MFLNTSYRKIKATFVKKKQCCTNISSLDRKWLFRNDENAEHIQTLYEVNKLDNVLKREEVNEDEKGDSMLKSEIDISSSFI